MDFSEQVRATFARAPDRRAIEFRGVWYSWGDIAGFAEALDNMLSAAGIAANVPVGIVARNRVFQVASILALVAYGRPITMLHAFQSPEALATDIGNVKLAAIIAERQDWSDAAVAAARDVGTVGVALTGELGSALAIVPGLDRLGPGPHRTASAEPTIELLTSGTTGTPKRVPIKFSVLSRGVASGTLGAADQDLPPNIMFWHIGNVGGVCNVITTGVVGSPMALMEKFSVAEFMDQVKRHKPTLISLTPTAVRMILDAKVPREAFTGVKSMFGGSAPLDAELEERFENTYGITVYWGYGATEFCGTVVRWTPELREKFGTTKRGSIGAAMPGVGVRAVDAETGAVVPAGTPGLLEARVPEIGPDWIRTTDLVVIDADGFVFHKGRNDGAIVRGGFKVLPETIVEVLRQHPSVADAAVVGLPDARLQEVPVAAVELRPGAPRPTDADLEAHIRRHLTAPHVPVRFMIVDALPRTPSMKASLKDIKRLFEAAA
ncbi:MAG TPA: class I adenylate-forming enzyme family protein [Alphaproteobacteria bacterium]|nr:class I adenylate-forming enzyme family protein [Alphaproteobacteria bacterium]